MARVSKSSLQSLIQGVALPDLPPVTGDWEKDSLQEIIWKRKLAEYLRRLGQTLTQQNISNELGGVPGFGPLIVEVYADYPFVDSTTPFPDKTLLVGTARDSNLHVRGLEMRWGIGNNFSINADRLLCRAVRYKGKIAPEASLSYRLEFQHDDGMRFYFDGSLAVDDWGGSGSNTFDTPVLVAGAEYPFVLEVCNSNGDDFNFYVLWRTSAESATRNIPFSALRAP